MRTFFNISKKIVEVMEGHPNFGPRGGRIFGGILVGFFGKFWSKTGKSRYLEIQGELGEGMVISRCTTTAPTGFKPVSGPSEHFFPS